MCPLFQLSLGLTPSLLLSHAARLPSVPPPSLTVLFPVVFPLLSRRVPLCLPLGTWLPSRPGGVE